MGAHRNQFETGDIARHYRDYLEPVLFAPWAERFVAWAGVSEGDVVVDLAAGTGVVARVAARAAGSTGRVVASDISVRMLDQAGRAREPRAAAITPLVGPATSLDLPDASVDVVLCQHGVTFMPDRAAVLRECRRVLRPGGTMALAVWAQGERLEPFDSYADALNEHGGLARRIDNTAVSLGLPDVIDDLVGAGLREVAVTRSTLVVRWPTLDSEVAGLFGTPFAPLAEAMDAPRRARVLARLRELLGSGGSTVDQVTTAIFGRGIR